MLTAVVSRPHRGPIAVWALVVYPLLGVALFQAFVMADSMFGEDTLAWLPGATAVLSALGLSATLTALTVYRRGKSLPVVVLLVAGALVMTVVWFWLSFWLLVSIDGSSGGDLYD